MTMTSERPLRGAAVRHAIVEAAASLFGEHGIRAVSADRIIAAAGCSKVTFYRHFPSKDDVVVAYLERDLARVREVLESVEEGAPPEDGATPGIGAVADALTEEMCRPHFRGCPFINAAAEYPDPEHPVRRVVADFRALMIGAIAGWARTLGAAAPDELAEQVMMLRDGALVAGYLSGDPATVARELERSLAAVLRAAGVEPA